MTTSHTPEKLRGFLNLIPGRELDRFPGYKISDEGTVWSVSTNWRGYGVRELNQTPNEDGYPSVRMRDREGVRRRIAVHRLVAMAWLGMPETGQQVRHLNGFKNDNRSSNLAWGSAKENAADRENHGRTSRGSRHSLAIKAGLAKATGISDWVIDHLDYHSEAGS